MASVRSWLLVVVVVVVRAVVMRSNTDDLSVWTDSAGRPEEAACPPRHGRQDGAETRPRSARPPSAADTKNDTIVRRMPIAETACDPSLVGHAEAGAERVADDRYPVAAWSCELPAQQGFWLYAGDRDCAPCRVVVARIWHAAGSWSQLRPRESALRQWWSRATVAARGSRAQSRARLGGLSGRSRSGEAEGSCHGTSSS